MTMFRRDSSGTEAAFDVDLQPSARTLGHVMFRYQLFPSALAVRLQSAISIFRLSRSSAAVKIDFTNPAASDASLKLFKYTQIESTNRLALDIEKLGFLGLMPSVFTGLDLTLLTGDIGNSTAIVPVFGIGLTNGHF